MKTFKYFLRRLFLLESLKSVFISLFWSVPLGLAVSIIIICSKFTMNTYTNHIWFLSFYYFWKRISFFLSFYFLRISFSFFFFFSKKRGRGRGRTKLFFMIQYTVQIPDVKEKNWNWGYNHSRNEVFQWKYVFRKHIYKITG